MKIIVIEKKGAVKEQINEIKPQLRDIIVNLQKSDTLKSKLTKAIIFNSSKDVDEDRVMHSRSNKTEFMPI